MKHLMRFELDDGSFVYVEGEASEEDGARRRVARGERGVEQTGQRFTEAIARIRPAAEAICKAFRGLEAPQEIALEFGIKFKATLGVIITSVDSEATYRVTLKWSNKQRG